MSKEIDFTREADYNKAVEGFKEYDHFGNLHIVIEDGNVEDGNINFCRNLDLFEHEIKFLDLIQSMPYGMRYAAYLES